MIKGLNEFFEFAIFEKQVIHVTTKTSNFFCPMPKSLTSSMSKKKNVLNKNVQQMSNFFVKCLSVEFDVLVRPSIRPAASNLIVFQFIWLWIRHVRPSVRPSASKLNHKTIYIASNLMCPSVHPSGRPASNGQFHELWHPSNRKQWTSHSSTLPFQNAS